MAVMDVRVNFWVHSVSIPYTVLWYDLFKSSKKKSMFLNRHHRSCWLIKLGLFKVKFQCVDYQYSGQYKKRKKSIRRKHHMFLLYNGKVMGSKNQCVVIRTKFIQVMTNALITLQKQIERTILIINLVVYSFQNWS